jgi:hypothetical protein
MKAKFKIKLTQIKNQIEYHQQNFYDVRNLAQKLKVKLPLESNK